MTSTVLGVHLNFSACVPVLQLEEYLERPRGLPKLKRDLGNTKQRFEKEAAMSKTLLTPPKGPASATSTGGTAASTPAAAGGESGEYQDDFFGDDPFATDKAAGTGTSTGARSNKRMVPTDFRRPGLAPPDLPGRDAELPDYDKTLASAVSARSHFLLRLKGREARGGRLPESPTEVRL